jgi:hypothetical protein
MSATAADESTIFSPQHHIRRHPKRRGEEKSPFSINLSTELITHAPFRLVRRLLRAGSRVTSAASLG